MQDRMLIDLHSHVLPQFDDGSPDVGTSAAMLRREAEQGVDVVCATSHYYAHREGIDTFCERRAEAMERLAVVLTEDLPQVLPAAEVAYFPRMEEQDLTPLCIQGTRTLLLEMSFADWTSLQAEAVEALVLDCGYQVVLVHPDWQNCPSACRSTRAACSAGGHGGWRWTCCSWPIGPYWAATATT